MAAVKYLDENGLSTVWSKVKGIVTPKADKVSGATAGHLAGLNSNGNLMDSGLPATNVAQKDGSYSGMTVGAAEDLVSAESVASEFTSRITGGSTAVGKGGTALLDKIKGRTLVWNQKINILPTTGSEDVSGVKNEDGSYTLTVTSTLSANVNLTVIYIFRDGDLNHKFLFGIDRDNEYVCLRNANLGNIETTTIKTLTSTTQKEIRLRVAAGTPAGTYHITPICVDLTLMFGAGNEPSTPEEFKELYPKPNYAYNPGELINNGKQEEYDVVWNQLYDGPGTTSSNGVSFTKIADNTYSIDGTAGAAFNTLASSPTLTAGHKYYVYQKLASGSFTTRGAMVQLIGTESVALSQTVYSGVVSQGETADATFRFHVSAGDVFTNAVMSFGFIDLTLMFGAGNEPSAAEFDEMFPDFNAAYDTGTEQHFSFPQFKTKIETVGWNIWDEEWEVGSIDDTTGANTETSTTFRSKNYIPVKPSTAYYIKRSDYSENSRVCYYQYDENKNYLGLYNNTNNAAVTLSEKTRYLRFRCVSSGATYNNDICISLPDPSRNGTYEPYWRSELDLNIPTLTGKLNGTGNSVVIFPDGLRSAGTVFDEIVGNKAIKRIESVDMGSLTWTYTESSSRFYSNVLSAAAATGYNCICTKYRGSSASNLTIFIGNNSRVYAYDSAYTDSATFKASLAGVTLYYELATPEEYILDEAIPTAMRNDPYGTERRLPEDTAAIVTAPFRADITYSTNIKEAVQSLPQNYINVNSMQDFLAALGALMGGTWTMRQADGKFDFTFTPNPSNE